MDMRRLSLVLYSVGTATWVLTMLVTALIFKHRSPLKIFNRSPSLATLLAMIIFVAVTSLLAFPQWILVTLDCFPEVEQSVSVLVVVNLICHASHAFYDSASLVLFIQRILILRFPTKHFKTTHTVLWFVAFSVATVAMIALFVAFFDGNETTAERLPKECFAMACTVPFQKRAKYVYSITRNIYSVSVTIIGSVFLIMFYKYSQHFPHHSVNMKFNRITRYIFVMRVILEMCPFIADMITIYITSTSVAFYIGPFGAISYSLEAFSCMLAYYFAFASESKVIAISVAGTS